MVEIGKIYKVRLQPQLLTKAVMRASKDLVKRYPHYADLQGKEVMVLSKNSTNVKAGIVENGRPVEDYWFTISSRWLIPVNSGPCNCDLRLLMCQGCQCGALENEKAAEKEQQNAKEEFPPW